MAAGGTGGTLWIKMLVGGAVLVGAAIGLEQTGNGPVWLIAALLAVGGMAVIFGSVESMIKSVEGIAGRAKWNKFVAGTMAGLASNVPEIVMLGFVIAAEPKVGFIVVIFTVHVGAMAFGIYSGLLPRDKEGFAKLPTPLVNLSTDLYACAGAVFLATGAIMLAMHDFGGQGTDALSIADLYVIGGLLLFVEVVAIMRLVARFSKEAVAEQAADDIPDRPEPEQDEELMGVGGIVGYGLLGVGASVVGGHAVGDFAGVLVAGLTDAGFSEMFGALVLAIFACAGAYAMAASAHTKGMYDIALASVSGQVTQVPFVVMPIAMIQMAIFGQAGIIPVSPDGGVLPIDIQTTSIMLLAFPPMLILWKSIQDDGKVNWVETAAMTAVFALTLWFLAQHGG